MTKILKTFEHKDRKMQIWDSEINQEYRYTLYIDNFGRGYKTLNGVTRAFYEEIGSHMYLQMVIHKDEWEQGKIDNLLGVRDAMDEITRGME